MLVGFGALRKYSWGGGKVYRTGVRKVGEKREIFATVEFRITNVELYSTKGIGIVRNLG